MVTMQTYTFIVRVWWEPREIEGAAPIFRGVVEHVPSGAKHAVSDLLEIATVIERYTGPTSPPEAPDTPEASLLEQLRALLKRLR